jgi:hypothetical protein
MVNRSAKPPGLPGHGARELGPPMRAMTLTDMVVGPAYRGRSGAAADASGAGARPIESVVWGETLDPSAARSNPAIMI